MSKMRLTLRLPVIAGVCVMMALMTACADSTGPASARRSGYLTASSSVSVDTSKSSTTLSPNRGKVPRNTPNSGYNVPAE